MKPVVALVAFILLAVCPVQAHQPADAPHQTFPLGELKLVSGETIRDFSLSFVTHGRLNEAKDNAVLMLAPFAGNHHHNEALIGTGKAFDTERFFVICVDPIGNGLTTSPSTSTTQPGPSFPRFTVLDMVQSQYRLITEHFGIQRLAAVSGASLGGMQSLQWAVRYPDKVAAVVALVPSARISPWTRTLMELMRQAITLDPAWNKGNYTSPPEQGLRLWAGLLFGVALSTPHAVNAQATSSEQGALRLAAVEDQLWKIMDANDILAQIEATTTFDLGATPGFDGDTHKALASIRARTLILLGEQDLIVPEDPMKDDATHIPQATVVMVNGRVPLGHVAGTGNSEMDFKNRIIADFLSAGTAHTMP